MPPDHAAASLAGRCPRPMASEQQGATVPASGVQQVPALPFLIVGVTGGGRAFRPSDWSERLAGIMAPFQPPGSGVRSHLHYSPYVLPLQHGGQKCVRVDPAIGNVEPKALAFLLNFARDNDLQLLIPAPR